MVIDDGAKLESGYKRVSDSGSVGNNDPDDQYCATCSRAG